MSKKKIGFHRQHDRHATAYTGELVDHRTGVIFTPPSRTKQSFVAECDINNILKQYKATGMIRHMSAKAASGVYADLPDEIDFQQSMNIVQQGERAFASLPSKVRSRFHNNPTEFLEFMGNPENVDEAVKLGLATKKEPPPKPPAQPSGPPEPKIPALEPKTGGEGGRPPS